eukprot:scaffold132242_cov15-Tisochrysis_lutea.AAC.2
MGGHRCDTRERADCLEMSLQCHKGGAKAASDRWGAKAAHAKAGNWRQHTDAGLWQHLVSMTDDCHFL